MLKRIMKRSMCVLTVLLMLPLARAGAEAEGHYSWYEVFVRSYQDSDGDGLGDLNGLAERLDYISGMGFDGLWLMPVMPSPSYHKYDVTDYMAVDAEYGTADDARALVDQAHARGIAVIFDLPVNHTSTRHPWFEAAAGALREGKDSPYTDYYHFRREPGPGYVQLDGTGWYYEEQFAGGGMPDLNLDSEAVRGELKAILSFWLRDIGADGFRLDAVTSFYTGDNDRNIEFLSWLRKECESIKPGSFLVGECWAGLSTIAQYYRSGGDCFFLFPASQAEGFVISSLRGRSGHAAKFAASYQNALDLIPGARQAPFLSNHDTGRTIGSVQGRGNPSAAKFVEGLLSVMNGYTFTYYGEEIGMVGSGDDPNKRLAMYWSDDSGAMTEQPPGVTALEYAYPPLDVQRADESSLWSYIAEAFRMRKTVPAIARGENSFLLAEGDVCLMRRAYGEEDCLIAVNFSSGKDQVCPIEDGFGILYELETGEGRASIGESGLILPPYAIVVLGRIG